jgi:serine/threonine-protein kinase Stk1
MKPECGLSGDGIIERQAGELTLFALSGGLGIKPASEDFSTEIPDVLCGRYRLENLLGAGGMGVVYQARDLLHEQFGEPDPYIAIKLLNEDFSGVPDAGVVLYREFAMTRHLCHPHVLRMRSFEVDLACRRVFITQDLIRGIGLDKLLCEHPLGLKPEDIEPVAAPVLDALAHSHEQGVMHGDLKPGNIMLTGNGPRLMDFGLGEPMEGVLKGLPRLSRDRFDAWTPGYAAPELLEGEPLSRRADVYAMACVLYELASGKLPYAKVPGRVCGLSDGKLLAAPPNLPPRFWPALRHALEIDPEKRTIAVRELHEAFCARPIGRVGF